MSPDSLWIEREDGSKRLDSVKLQNLREESGRQSNIEAATALVQLLEEEFRSYGTDSKHSMTVEESREAMRVLIALTKRLKIPFTPPYRDFSGFQDYWATHGGYGSWAVRHNMVRELFGPVRQQLEDLEEGTSSPVEARGSAEGEQLWTPGTLRLFLSHTSTHKVQVGLLKFELARLGVSCFVAHEDIEPSTEWQEEIMAAVFSMHALAGLLTSDFHASNWTDQEIGMGFGRQVLVIAVNLGQTPYGFMGKHQQLRGDLGEPGELALALARVLVKNGATRDVMAEALVVALENSGSYATSKALAELIELAPSFSKPQLARLAQAIRENDQVANSFYVPGRIKEVLRAPRTLLELYAT